MKAEIQLAIQEARAKRPGSIISSKEIYESIYRAGIKEVVEWINSYTCECTEGFGAVCLFKREWQSKLKEWGIDENTGEQSEPV